MNRVVIYFIHPLINMGLLAILFTLLVNMERFYELKFIVSYIVVAIIINTLMYCWVYRITDWRYFFSSIGLYLAYIVIYLVFKISTGNGTTHAEDENLAAGFLLIVVFIHSFLWIIPGGLIGLMWNRYHKN